MSFNWTSALVFESSGLSIQSSKIEELKPNSSLRILKFLTQDFKLKIIIHILEFKTFFDIC